MKIIQIVENLDRGAVENWIVRTFIESNKQRPNWRWTFYCILGKPGRLDEIVKQAGGLIIYAPVWINNKFKFLKHLRSVLKQGQYDILHAHHDFLSGFYLLASWGIKFNKRILHLHNNGRALPVGNKRLNDFLIYPFRLSAYYFSDVILGISRFTLKDFTRGSKFGLSSREEVLYCGIDLSGFQNTEPGIQLRSQLGLPKGSKILLFIGRLIEYKNPLFVVDILEEILKIRKDVYAIFVGNGNLEGTIESKARALEIAEKVIVMGWRDDIPAIMLESDVIVLPGLEEPKEGLGLVVVEAQAAGLPAFITHSIIEDAVVIPSLVQYLPLANNPKEWALKIHTTLEKGSPVTREAAFKQVRESPFELALATRNLISIYES